MDVGKEASFNLYFANYAITRHCGHSPGIPRSMTQEMTWNTFYSWQVDTYLMLLTTSSDAFYHLKDCR